MSFGTICFLNQINIIYFISCRLILKNWDRFNKETSCPLYVKNKSDFEHVQVLFIHVFILLFWGLISGGLYPGGLYPGGLYLGAYKWGTTVYLGDYIYIYVKVYVNLDIECSMPLWQSKV